MDKKDFKELDAVGLRDYYSKLSRSEKGRFLRYLVDEVLINLAINNESLWRG